jgi:hypothetical protein
MADPKDISAEVNESFAVTTIRALCKSYEEGNRGAVRGHAQSLRTIAQTTNNPTIKFAADEAEAILKLMG